MGERIQAIRGMNDILPVHSYAWQIIEQSFARCAASYGYQEIRMPLLESTRLFQRSIGEVTDIVEKEMYTFTDRNGDSLTLRPEGTAGCIRACLEHGLLHNQQQKLWYCGPMFRHEKPQKGRYRQFCQLGVEAFGYAGIEIELELLLLCQRLWRMLGIDKAVTLQINTLGEPEERQAYRKALIEYFLPHKEILDTDCQGRLHTNPLRILDSKNPALTTLIQSAPKLLDSLSEASRSYFDDLCQKLTALGITYTINPALVRGLDYYGHTVFEWVTEHLGSQATVCAGGRFDRLVEQLGGQPTPAIGFALGVERLLLLREAVLNTANVEPEPFAFIVAMGQAAEFKALQLAEHLRDQLQQKILVNVAGGSFKSQFKKADKSRARVALILGDEEMQAMTIGIKDLRQGGEQQLINQSELVPFLRHLEEHHVSVHD